jgi:hypothetical protein
MVPMATDPAATAPLATDPAGKLSNLAKLYFQSAQGTPEPKPCCNSV